MRKGTLAISASFFLISTCALSQITPCAQWDSLKGRTSVDFKEAVFRLLKSKPNQKDCLFENCLLLFHQNNSKTFDSVQKICATWQAVSEHPCKGKVAYLEFISSHFSDDIQESFCKESYSAYSDCGFSSFSPPLSLFVTLCPEFSCRELDSLYKNRLKTMDLEQAKKVNNLLAQRNCTTSGTFKETNKLITEKEPSFQALYQLAVQYHKAGIWKDAYHYYSRSEKLAQSPSQQTLCFLGIAKALAEQKNWSKSKDFALLATQTDPQSQESFVFLAQLLLKAEQMCSFTKEEKAALHVWIARCHQKAGNKEESDNYFKKGNPKAMAEDSSALSVVKLGCFLNEEVKLKNEKP